MAEKRGRKPHVCDFIAAAFGEYFRKIGEARFVSLRHATHASAARVEGWIVTVLAGGVQVETSPEETIVAAMRAAARYLEEYDRTVSQRRK